MIQQNNAPRPAGAAGAAGRPARRLGLIVLGALLAACASKPLPPPAPTPAPPQPTLGELMGAAQTAVQSGAKEVARQSWREAAKAYPVAKEPWVKLAEAYFESADYGNAILAAQEVAQRDPQERSAHSVLAVAGLRVAAGALAALRAQQTGLPQDTRSEAQLLTQALRETLGEQVLVPRVEAAAPPQPKRRKSKAATDGLAAPAAASEGPRSGEASRAAAVDKTPRTEAPAAKSPAKPAANPFDILR